MIQSDNVQPAHTFIYDGTQINILFANKGQGLLKHQHEYAHATFCCAGSLIVRKENKEIVIDKNSQPINLVAGEWHELEAAQDGTVFVNVFAQGKY